MARRHSELILLVVFGGLSLLALRGGPARAAQSSQAVAIANFDYTPQFLEVSAGDTVVWSNLDATVHTVTDDAGAFISGSIHQGQTYSLQFNQPGVYSYFCEPHPKMRGRIVVTGSSGASPSPTTSTPTTVAATTTVPARAVAGSVLPTTSTVPPATAVGWSAAPPSPIAVAAGASRIVPSHSAAVSAGVLSGRSRRLAAPLIAIAIGALAVVSFAGTSTRARSVAAGATVTAGILTLASAVLHLELHYALRYPEPIGTLMILAAGAGTLVGAYLLLTPADPGAIALGVAFNAGLIVAFVLSRTHFGFFGYREVGWEPSPQAAAAVAMEASAIAALAVGLYVSGRSRYSRGSRTDSSFHL